MNHSGTRKENGFTLIELLVVIAIMGLLASVVLASLNSARAKARDAKMAAEMRSMVIAAELFFDDNGYYPRDGMGNSWLYSPVRGAASNATMKNDFAPYINLPDSPQFDNPQKFIAPSWRMNYKVVGNPAYVNAAHGTDCTFNIVTAQGNCYFIAIWPETTGQLGTANIVSYYLNGNRIVQAYDPFNMH